MTSDTSQSNGIASMDETKTPSTPDPFMVHLQTCSKLLSDGRLEDALVEANAARQIGPQRPEADYAAGEVFLAQGDLIQADQAFKDAIQKAPTWPDAWINFGLTRYRLGNIEHAKNAMREALRHAPDNQAAAANLGALMRISGEHEGAENLLQKTLDAEPYNVAARLNLVADLINEERPAEALAILDAAPELPEELQPRRHWLLQKSIALLVQNRLAEGQAVLQEFDALGPIPPEIRPLYLWRRIVLAQSVGDLNGAATLADTMEESIGEMGPDGVPEHQIMAYYDLAKFWSGLNEPSRAFSQWLKGHALLKQIQPFSREEHLAFVEASIKAFPQSRFEQSSIASNGDTAPVFIIGMPRSGTTLCEQIVAAHRQVYGAGERSNLGQLAQRLGDPEAIAGLEREALDEIAATYLANLHALAPDKTRIIDKMPGNYLYVGLAALLFPKAKFIHCLRDPRDIGLSIFTFRFHGYHGYAHDLGDMGWTIAQQLRLMEHWKSVLPGRILEVRLSDWVDNFNGTLKNVLTHLDLPPDANCERFYETESRARTVSRSQVKQPVNASGLGRWVAYKDELQPLIAELDAAGALKDWEAR